MVTQTTLIILIGYTLPDQSHELASHIQLHWRLPNIIISTLPATIDAVAKMSCLENGSCRSIAANTALLSNSIDPRGAVMDCDANPKPKKAPTFPNEQIMKPELTLEIMIFK